MRISNWTTSAGAALIGLAVAAPFNAQAENTSGIGNGYMFDLSLQVVTKTQVVDDGAHVRRYVGRLRTILSLGPQPYALVDELGLGKTWFNTVIGPNYAHPTVCVEHEGKTPAGAWEIMATSVRLVASPSSCRDFLQEKVNSYVSSGLTAKFADDLLK